ncbi:uncharacterized protein LOC127788989 [Diospyros lotus]|uniref:uncharacterized protein LOC127788989 n=1 Tax=Diospyros lotus TaxID=55363 RepID=UPI00224D8DF5|nr:uncharacterized protein LOC127788989 [Diospyros lotus]
MLAAKSPIAGDQIQQPKSARKPLQPRNSQANLPIDDRLKLKSKAQWIDISVMNDSNKENCHQLQPAPATVSSFDASLAEELSAIRQKNERLRLEKEKTEKILGDRDLVLEMNLKELITRGEFQKQLEIEVDRLFRLKELKSFCMKISPHRSLREKEQGRKIKEGQSQEMDAEESIESTSEITSPSNTSQIDTKK